MISSPERACQEFFCGFFWRGTCLEGVIENQSPTVVRLDFACLPCLALVNLHDRDCGIRALDLNDFHARLTSIDCSRFRRSAKNEYLIACGAITALYPRLRSTCRLSQGPSPRLQIPNSNSRRFRRIQWHQWLDLTVQPIAIRATVGLPKPFQELAYGF